MGRWRGFLKGAALLLAAVAAVACFSAAVDQLNQDQGEEQLRQVEDAVRRSCATCYASEGIYPPDLDYLREHYGLQVDESRCTIHYVAIAQNLMPDITVLPQS